MLNQRSPASLGWRVYRVRFAAHSRSRGTIVPGFFLPRGAAPPKSGLNVTHPPTRSMLLFYAWRRSALDKYDSSSIAGGCPGHAQTFAFVGCLVSRLVMFFTLCHVRIRRFFISPPSSKALGSRPRALKMNPRPFLSQTRLWAFLRARTGPQTDAASQLRRERKP